MNILLLVAVIVAIAIVFVAHKYFTNQAILWLGALISSISGVALLLNLLNDDITQAIEVGERSATGEQMFIHGHSISILGEWWHFVLVAFLCGIALMCSAIFKRNSKTESDEIDHEPLSEDERIRQELQQEIDQVIRISENNPTQRGADDANNEGGPFPSRRTTEPTHYEQEIRRQYESLGTNFLARVVERLKQQITVALNNLADIKSAISNRPYAEMAARQYSERDARISDFDVNKKGDQVFRAKRERSKFIDTLALRPAERPDWGYARSSFKDISLWITALLFATWEFVGSWYFLKNQIGAADAIYYSVVAVFLITVLALGSAAFFPWMRRNQPTYIRTLSSTAYAICFFLLFIVFGMLLNGRNVQAQTGVADKLDAVFDGYVSLLGDLTNLTVFILNLFAFAVLYWKFLHCFDKFHGYSEVEKPYRKAKSEWGNIFSERTDSIEEVLDHVSAEAENHSSQSNRSFDELQESNSVLESIHSIIRAAYTGVLHPAYLADIREYRDSNCKHRAIEVNPAPAYFQSEAPFCEAQNHFTDDIGVDKFLQKHKEAIERANEDRQFIQQAKGNWHAESSQLNAKWTKEFQERVDAARQ